MTSSERTSQYWILVAASLSALSLAIAGSISQFASNSEPPDAWIDRLMSMEDRAAERRIRETGHSIPDGIPMLVQALQCERPFLSVTARNVLLGLVDEWQQIGDGDASLFIGQLAEELARRSGEMDSTAHRQAMYLVNRILRSPIDDRVLDPEKLVLNCEKVLHARSDFHRIASARLDGIVEFPEDQPVYTPLVPGSSAGIPKQGNDPIEIPIHEDQFVLPGGNIPVVPQPLTMNDQPGREKTTTR